MSDNNNAGAMTKAKSHLLKHEVPENVDSVLHFGTDDKKEIAKKVQLWGQRELQVSLWVVLMSLSYQNACRGLRRGFAGAASREGGMQPVLTGAICWPERLPAGCRKSLQRYTILVQALTTTTG